MSRTKWFGLGGMQEIGKAGFLIEHEDEIVIVDNGVKFANSMETGVQAIIPNYQYLIDNKEKIKGLFITHGHLDHMGAIAYLLQQVHIPKIYAPRIALLLIKSKCKEFRVGNNVEWIEIDRDLDIKTKYFEVDSWTTQHSVPDAYGIRVKTPNGSIFYTGDYRFDYTPLGNKTDFDKLKQMGDEGMTVLLSDSTNAFSQNHSPTDANLMKDIEKFSAEAKGKVILTTFGSQLVRIQAMVEMAQRLGRKVLLVGRSMIDNTAFAKELGYINAPDDIFVDKRDVSKIPDEKLLIITTGSQGEEMAGLSRMAYGKHLQVKLKKGDLIIFSSSPIPGNRMKIELLINQLYKSGADIKENGIDGMLHVSGHAYKDEHIKTFELARPKYFVPFHGSYRMSAVHNITAVQTGVKKENVHVPTFGEVMYLDKGELIISDEWVDVGPVYVDSNKISSTNGSVIQKRKDLGENGFVNVSVMIDRKKSIILGRTRILARGVLYSKTNQEFLNEVQRMAHGSILHIIK
ncbi:MAG: ribonuclease J, partial [Mycoplasmataceae bacterium]|nr:ribonuclease J [Mycoplasmataceae bacterium]